MTTSTRSAIASGMLAEATGSGKKPPSVAICTSGWPELRASRRGVALDPLRMRNRYLRVATSSRGHGAPLTRMVPPFAASPWKVS